MKTYYSGVDSIPIYVPVPEGGDLPERVKVNLYKNNALERTLKLDPGHPDNDYITPTYEVVGDVRVYNPIETSWAIPAPETSAENCYFEVVGVDYENDVVATSEKFIISRKPVISGIELNTITITGQFLDAGSKKVAVDGVEATVVSQDATSITFTPVTPLLLTGEYSITVTLADGSTQLYTWKFGTFISAGRMRTNVSVKVGF